MALSRILMGRMDGPLTAEQEKQVGFIHRAAQELTEMVNDLLDLAKVEAGKIELHPGEWKLTTLLGTLRGMMRPLLLNTPVHLVIEDADDVPEMFTDEAKVAQILRNFLSNAIKFTDEGEIRLVSHYDPATNTVSIAVSDTGMGIAPEDQARIFEQFVQVESAKQRLVKGTGLGLSLSTKLAGLLGGDITLHSQPGRGSTFTLTIPVRVAEPALMSSAAASVPAEPGAQASPPDRRTYTILIIDDEELARYLIRKQLAGLRLAIREARSGPEGIQLAAETRPDLVILDLAMPDMSGFEVLDRLRSRSETRGIPVIVHTSRTIGGPERERLVSQASAVVGKGPAGTGELRRSVEELMKIAEVGSLHRAGNHPER
jgi:CheY-like chemotaxis protein